VIFYRKAAKSAEFKSFDQICLEGIKLFYRHEYQFIADLVS